MRTLFASVVLLAAITSSCDSETVTSNIQTTSESVASSVGEAEIVRAGGTLKLSASAELRIPLHGVTAELTLESSITTSPSSEEFGIVAGTFDITPSAFPFQRPARFSVTAPEDTERLGVIWRASASDEWVGLPSTILTTDTNGDGVIDSRQLVAWVLQTGQLAAVRYSSDVGACCDGESCSVTPRAQCQGAYLGAGSTCTIDGSDVCGTRCCLGAVAPGVATTAEQNSLLGCLETERWPLGENSTCDTQCCSVESGPGSVSRYSGLCTDTPNTSACNVCCIDDSTGQYTDAGSCTVIDPTGASCETICCASSALSPVQGFARVTRTECQAAAGLESFSRYCDLCAEDADCQDAPSICHETQGTCGDDGLCSYAPAGDCAANADCGESGTCTNDCSCE